MAERAIYRTSLTNVWTSKWTVCSLGLELLQKFPFPSSNPPTYCIYIGLLIFICSLLLCVWFVVKHFMMYNVQ